MPSGSVPVTYGIQVSFAFQSLPGYLFGTSAQGALAGVSGPSNQPSAAQFAAPSAPPKSGRRRAFWAALSFAMLALVLLGWNISLRSELDLQTAQVVQSRKDWQTMIVLLDDTALARYAVAADPAPAAGQYPAHGHFWASPQGQVACLVVQNLPELRADQVYQI